MRKFLRPPLPVCIEIYTKMVYIILNKRKNAVNGRPPAQTT